MTFGPASLFAAAGAVLFIVLALLTMLQPGRNRLRRALFAVFLVLFSLPLANIVIADSGLALIEPRLLFIGNTLGLAAAPVLYLFARSLAVAGFALRPAAVLHFLPLLIIAGLVAWQFHLQPEAVRIAVATGQASGSWLDAPGFVLVIFAYPLVYLSLTLLLAWRYEKGAQATRSASDGRELRWLAVSLTGLFGSAVLSLAHYAVVHIWPVAGLSWLLMALLMAGSLALGVYFILSAFRSLDTAVPLDSGALSPEKYGEHRLEDAQLTELTAALEAHMAAVRPHLEPELTLEALARELPMTGRELSQVINRAHGLSFYEFVARWRVREAKDRLREDPGLSITMAMHDSGFSSKSSFAKAFRRETGLTPSAWRAERSHTRPRTT
ncbi:helix-turn-helix domain-containing protein [Hyphobacterium sp.]|jgi:AraC-like DNA-binding protein|uniref:AraC family transcriptional regulator n=1 Tax=Hyphobacterium sp. TaxID=2004662 RepID=UPI003BAD42A6